MPTNTDNSGTARTARLRQILASQRPLPNNLKIASLALDVKLGKMECCPCRFNWTGSPIQLAYQETAGTDLLFTAVFANATGQVVPQFGQVDPSPCGTGVAQIETFYSNNGGALSVTYTISNESPSYIPATITQQIPLLVKCGGITATYERTMTFLVPEAYRTVCP
jgi:hypothetical protein